MNREWSRAKQCLGHMVEGSVTRPINTTNKSRQGLVSGLHTFNPLPQSFAQLSTSRLEPPNSESNSNLLGQPCSTSPSLDALVAIPSSPVSLSNLPPCTIPSFQCVFNCLFARFSTSSLTSTADLNGNKAVNKLPARRNFAH